MDAQKFGSVYIKTYGCQMNVYDSNMMANIMEESGFAITENIDDASLIIINTCNVREKAVEKLYSQLGRIRPIKEKNNAVLIVSGCVAQAEGSEIFSRTPFVDAIIGPQNIHKIFEVFMQARSNGEFIEDLDFPNVTKFDATDLSPKTQNITEFVSIQEGCDKMCKFCSIPYTRGPEYSRPVNEIYREVMKLVDQGTSEIILLGQNVSAYHGVADGRVFNLGELISHLSKISGLGRISYTTSHPRDMHEEMYQMHAEGTKVMPYLHLPVQSGSDKVLKQMNRGHTRDQYLAIINKIREIRPDIAISSDFIVGYPGETDRDFEDTLSLVETVEFSQSYSFKYSPRPGTPGSMRLDQIPEKIKSDRLCALQALLKHKQKKFNASTVGKKLIAVFCEKQRSNDVTKAPVGKTEYMQSVYVENNTRSLNNSIVPVLITDAAAGWVRGSVVDHNHS